MERLSKTWENKKLCGAVLLSCLLLCDLGLEFCSLSSGILSFQMSHYFKRNRR